MIHLLLLLSCNPVEAVFGDDSTLTDSGSTLDLPDDSGDSDTIVDLPDSGEADADTDTDTDADTDADADSDADSDADTDTDPCAVAIPAGVEVIDRDASSADDGLSAWVCKNKTLSFSGDSGTIYLAERGDVITIGSGTTIYAPDNTEVYIFGGAHTIYATPDAEITDSSDGTATITTVKCEAISYDKTTAPTDGC